MTAVVELGVRLRADQCCQPVRIVISCEEEIRLCADVLRRCHALNPLLAAWLL